MSQLSFQPARTPLHRRATLAAGATLAVLAAAVVGAGPASAHVSVNPGQASAGGFTKLTFRVPSESPTAGTTALSVSFPTDTPLASVSVKPHPGWVAKVTKSKLPKPVAVDDLSVTEAVSRITWTAQKGVRIGPGQFDEFDVSVGPVPAGAKALSFPAVQTYDDGSKVNWNQPVTAGGAEPEHPAPTLTVTPAAAEASAPATTAASTPAAAPVASTKSTDTTARTLGTVGLVAGLLGLLLGAAGLAAGRRRTRGA
jgi:periplasmic copper chaperone A